MSFRSQVLDIQHKLNASFVNNDDQSVVRRMNLINADLYEIIALEDKFEPYEHIIEEFKNERDRLSPVQESEMEIMDELIYKLEQLLYSKT